MKKKFTDEEILSFLYDEMDGPTSEEFLAAICADEELWSRYEHFQEVVEGISSLSYEPSEYSVQTVKAYVKASAGVSEIQPEPAVAAPSTTSSYILGKIPVTISLNAVIILAMILFVSVAIVGSAYKLSRGVIDNPNTGTLVHQVEVEEAPVFEWDDSAIDEELEVIRQGVEDLKDDAIL